MKRRKWTQARIPTPEGEEPGEYMTLADLPLVERQRMEATRIDLGTKIRKLRARRMLTMEAVARGAGCSRAFLSRVERNESMPSVATLVDIAHALGVPVGFFFEESEAERAVVTRASERQIEEEEGVKAEGLTRDVMTRKMGMQKLTIDPGASCSPRRHKFHDEAVGLVATGTVEIDCDHRTFALEAGDTFYLDSPAPYVLRNIGEQPSEVVLVNCKRTY